MNKKQKFSIRKYSVGVASVVIGSLLFGSHAVLAEETVAGNAVVEKEESITTEPEIGKNNSESAVSYSNSEEHKEATKEFYTKQEIEATVRNHGRWFEEVSPERSILDDEVEIAKQEFTLEHLTYESEKKIAKLLPEIRSLMEQYAEEKKSLSKEADVKKFEETYNTKWLNKAKELKTALEINPIREKYNLLEERVHYELRAEGAKKWTYDSHKKVRDIEVEMSDAREAVLNSAYSIGYDKLIYPLSDATMLELSNKMEKALDELEVDPEGQKIVDLFIELQKTFYEYREYIKKDLGGQVEADLSQYLAGPYYFWNELQGMSSESYAQHTARLADMMKILNSIPNAKERKRLERLNQHALNLAKGYVESESLEKLQQASNRVLEVLDKNAANELALREAGLALQKAIDNLKFLPDNSEFSNEVIKKVTIDKSKVNINDDKFVTIVVELQNNLPKGTPFLRTELLDRRNLGEFTRTRGTDYLDYTYYQRPIKQEGNVYTFILPIYKFIHNGKYAFNLDYQEGENKFLYSKVPYTLDVLGGYTYKHKRPIVTDTQIGRRVVSPGDMIVFRSKYYGLSSNNDVNNTLFDVYKVGESKPVKRLRVGHLGTKSGTTYIPYYLDYLYSEFKIDDTFTEGEYEIRPADLTDMTMSDRLTVSFDMIERYVQRFKVVKSNKEHVEIKGETNPKPSEGDQQVPPKSDGDNHKVTDLDKDPKPSEGDQQVPPKPDGDNHKVTDLDKNPKPSEGDTQTPPKADGENQLTPTPQPNNNTLVTPGSNGQTTPSQPSTPSKPEAKPAQPISKPKPKADTAEKPQEAPQPSATANTTVAAPSAPTAVAQATPAPKGETLPETGEASTAWFTLASVAVLVSLGLVATKRPEDV